MRVNREQFLSVLQFVSSGLSQVKETTNQSSCFVFQNGNVYTFNGDVANRRPSGLDKAFTAAVRGDKLLSQVTKFSSDEMDLRIKDSHLVISALKGGRRAGVRMDAEITMPFDEMEKPGEWKPLPDSFSDAINTVQHCAGTDDSFFYLTCVHIHPKHVESFDNYQICRWSLDVPVDSPLIVKKDSIKHLVAIGATHIAMSEHWVHFRTAQKQIFSCKRYVEEYPELDELFDVQGSTITLPKALVEACDRANDFSMDCGADDNLMTVQLTANKLTVSATGAYGWYTEPKKVIYNGPDLCFMIPPSVLSELTKRHSECVVSETGILVDNGVYKFATRLTVPNAKASDRMVMTAEAE